MVVSATQHFGCKQDMARDSLGGAARWAGGGAATGWRGRHAPACVTHLVLPGSVHHVRPPVARPSNVHKSPAVGPSGFDQEEGRGASDRRGTGGQAPRSARMPGCRVLPLGATAGITPKEIAMSIPPRTQQISPFAPAMGSMYPRYHGLSLVCAALSLHRVTKRPGIWALTTPAILPGRQANQCAARYRTGVGEE